MKCKICEIGCDIIESGTGRCGMYTQDNSEIREIYPDRYLAAVDTAIESMPMVHYNPRGKFLQVCTVGCNFRCNGCVSEVLTNHICAMEGAFQLLSPEEIIEKAIEESCIGIMFCFNEPTVSYFTFLKLAEKAKKSSLLVGCSTNGYMTESALEEVMPCLDFVNVGLKGSSDRIYHDCGAPEGIAPVLRNISLLHRSGIHTEISAIYRKAGEDEIVGVAEFIASLSDEIPLQVMRFIPFGEASKEMEPSVRETEKICERLKSILKYVYLFNTPGTEYLHSCCPDCGSKILERGFFGPMCANLFRYRKDGICECGFKLPIKGKIHDTVLRESGYFGGYRTVNAMGMIRSILGLTGVTEKSEIDGIMARLIKEEFIKDLYMKLNTIDSYFDTVDYLASLAKKSSTAEKFRSYAEERIGLIEKKVQNVKRPSVYSSLGHPLIAMFEEKMESRLIEIAGGELVNRRIKRESRPGITISVEQLASLKPEIIVISDEAAWPVDDFISYCRKNSLDAPAVEQEAVFSLHPYRASTSPDWILGLMSLANIIHPEIFSFDLPKEADDFYNEFYGIPFSRVKDRKFQWSGSYKSVKNEIEIR